MVLWARMTWTLYQTHDVGEALWVVGERVCNSIVIRRKLMEVQQQQSLMFIIKRRRRTFRTTQITTASSRHRGIVSSRLLGRR